MGRWPAVFLPPPKLNHLDKALDCRRPETLKCHINHSKTKQFCETLGFQDNHSKSHSSRADFLESLHPLKQWVRWQEGQGIMEHISRKAGYSANTGPWEFRTAALWNTKRFCPNQLCLKRSTKKNFRPYAGILTRQELSHGNVHSIDKNIDRYEKQEAKLFHFLIAGTCEKRQRESFFICQPTTQSQ